MKWTQIEITDVDDKVYKGPEARKFVESNCNPPNSRAETKSRGDIVLYVGKTRYVQDHLIKERLGELLAGKIKSLAITEGKKTEVVNFPVAKKKENVINIFPPKLRVEFIFKHDIRMKEKVYLKDPVVAVTVNFAGHGPVAAKITKHDAPDGKVDLGSVTAGKYTLTPDYSKLEACKFDFEEKPVVVDLANGDPEKTVTFEVEPLYQQVQLIAHCILAIPDRIYEAGPGETLTPNPTPNQAPKLLAPNTLNGKWRGKYHGLPDDIADMNKRVELIEKMLAIALDKAEKDPKILKVFMLPECFFQGLYGAYRMENAGHLFSKLLELVKGVDWRDWVFVFGTVNFMFGEDINKVRPPQATYITEMMNYSPVFRGGLGLEKEEAGSGGEKDRHFHLIQKLINSAELLDAAEYIKDVRETRTPAVNDSVQFQATLNEERVGELLLRLSDETSYKVGEDQSDLAFGTTKLLPLQQWTQLKNALKQEVATLGLARVVRSIRLCNIQGTPDTLADWAYSGFKDHRLTHLNTNEVFLIKERPFQKIFDVFIQQEWDKYWIDQLKPGKERFKPPFARASWTRAGGNLRLQPVDVKGDAFEDVAIRQAKILAKVSEMINHIDCLPYQQEKLRQEVDMDAILLDPANLPGWTTGKAKYDDDKEIRSCLSLSIFPFWKKVLELYCREKAKDPTFLTQDKGTMDYRDYCFACARKAGTFLTLDEVENLDPCKKLVFGLEICADHANERLIAALKPRRVPDGLDPVAEEKLKAFERIKAKTKIDIQLIPSAGFYPVDTAVAAKTGGYAFNCDGWNKGGSVGVNSITEWFDGPADPNANPVTPHTAIAKGGVGVAREIASFTLEAIKLSDFIPADAGKDILNKAGMGKLHVYDELDLPTN